GCASTSALTHEHRAKFARPSRKVKMRSLPCRVLIVAVSAIGCGSTSDDASQSPNSGAAGKGAESTTSGAGGGSGGSVGTGSGGTSSSGGASTGGASGSTEVDASVVQDAGSPSDAGNTSTGTGCPAPGTLCWDFEEGMIPSGWTTSRSEFNGQ